MLLSQCLAVNLQANGSARKKQFEIENNVNQSSAILIFNQLIQQNCESEISNEDEAKKEDDVDKEDEFRMVLDRVEFAGFVVPNWLLLSGSFEDLHCIKLNWLNGRLKSPKGYKIEAIGNIRSINVDYLGLLSNNQSKKVMQTEVFQSPRQHQFDTKLSNKFQTNFNGKEKEQTKFDSNGIQASEMNYFADYESSSSGAFCDFSVSNSNSNSSQSQSQSSRIATTARNKSKSTTLDSGIRSFDLQEVASQANRTNERRRFSLSRSLSFGPTRKINNSKRAHSSERQTNQAKQQQESKEFKLSKLFRSRSMRAVINENKQTNGHFLNNHNENVNFYKDSFHRKEATIDYLNINENNPLNCELDSNSSASKLILFLKRIFSIKSGNKINCKNLNLITTKNEQIFTNQNENDTKFNFNNVNKTINDTDNKCKKVEQSFYSTSPSSNGSTSASSSLIETLDCSSEVKSSRRPLKEIRTFVNVSRGKVWSHLERSSSSLSQNSQASCSTTKSTASQQLRRHLDEAFRRHRKCTSQREREFIDSINVLRQASRHALQTSRSPSKSSRQTNSKSSASDEISIHSSRTSSSNGQSRFLSADLRQVPSRQEGEEEEEEEEEDDDQKDKNINYKANRKLDEQNETQRLPLDLKSNNCEQISTAIENCCICASYLNSGQLCSMASFALPPNCCCLQPPTLIHSQTDKLAQSQSDFCCPFWRSLSCPFCHQLNSTLQAGSFANLRQLHQLQQQQHQHNTTIDLKIEIGAELNGRLEQEIQKSTQIAEDSLDSDETDELVNRLHRFQQDSCESDIIELESTDGIKSADSLKSEN